MLSIVNRVLTTVCDLLLRPWAWESPWPALVFAAFVAACLFVGLFRLSSNQQALRRSRDRLIARVLELLLFRHDLGVSLSACWRIAVANVRYLATFARPMLVSLLPLLCMFTQLESWFESRPLRPNEAALVEIELDRAHSVLKSPLEITTSDSLRLEGSGVRIPLNNELCFSLRARQAGNGWVEVRVGDTVERRDIRVDDRLARVATHRQRPGLWRELWNPTESPLAANSPLVRFDIRYPARQLLLGEWEVHWTIAVFVLIMIFGLVLGKMFGIRIA